MSAERPVVLVTAPFDDRVLDELATTFDVRRHPGAASPAPLLETVPAEDLLDVAAIVCEADLLDEAALAAAPALELVVSCRSNPVNVDVDACARRGVIVGTTPGRNAEVTADLTFALLLATVRQVTAASAWMRAGRWSAGDPYEPYRRFRGRGLTGRVLGIVGGGAIGRRVARRAHGFGMGILIADPALEQADVGDLGTLVPLEELLRSCDILTVHAPLNEATRGLIGADELALLRPDAVVINAGRAAILDEEALLSALRAGQLAGAGLDVFWEEPLPAAHPLLGLENVVVTPHIGGASDDVIGEHSRLAARAVHAWFAGEDVPDAWRA
ncbi:MAG: 2-hydroxyacid dehydrogenase [Nitriliruptoraceae bacterium]